MIKNEKVLKRSQLHFKLQMSLKDAQWDKNGGK